MEYLTISEFAKTRNLNINSLRYYEKLGLLKPIYIDPLNNYRYYSVEQLPTLDFILLCVDLELPLKSLQDYIHGDNIQETKKLLDNGLTHMKAKMNDIQGRIDRILYALNYIAQFKLCAQESMPYHRMIPARQILAFPTSNIPAEKISLEKTVSSIYTYAEKAGLLPAFPVGAILDFRQGEMQSYMYLQVLGNITGVAHTTLLPAGRYLCMQIEFAESMDIREEITARYGDVSDKYIMIENMFFEKYDQTVQRSELQKFESIS